MGEICVFTFVGGSCQEEQQQHGREGDKKEKDFWLDLRGKFKKKKKLICSNNVGSDEKTQE